MFKFLMNYIKSMRLYYSFVTGIGGWAGVAYYEQLLEAGELQGPVLDLGKKSGDPHPSLPELGDQSNHQRFPGTQRRPDQRPPPPDGHGGAAGPPCPGALFGVDARCHVVFRPIPLANSEWTYLGRGRAQRPLQFLQSLGRLGQCGLWPYDRREPLVWILRRSAWPPLPWETNLWLLYAGVALLNGILTYYTYFKDYLGDKAVGQKTLVVALGLDKAKKLAVILSLLPSLAFVIAKFAFGVAVNPEFIILAVATTALHLWTGWHYYKNPQGEKLSGPEGQFSSRGLRAGEHHRPLYSLAGNDPLPCQFLPDWIPL
jgi:geranylgeranylglycerol-phosphate geranylgeranyltransferase